MTDNRCNICFHCIVEQVTRLAFDLLHGWANAIYKPIDFGLGLAVAFHGFDGGFHCAAFFVTQHHQERDVQFSKAKLKASQHGLINDLPCGTNDEQITQASIEDEFGRDARVNATKNSCKGLLAFGNFDATTFRLV